MTIQPTHSQAPAASAPQNLFGICARVGEDFGFNPLWLRLAFASALMLSPVAVIGTYFALGLIVLSSRVLFPTRKPIDSATPLALAADNQARSAAMAERDLPMAA